MFIFSDIERCSQYVVGSRWSHPLGSWGSTLMRLGQNPGQTELSGPRMGLVSPHSPTSAEPSLSMAKFCSVCTL